MSLSLKKGSLTISDLPMSVYALVTISILGDQWFQHVQATT